MQEKEGGARERRGIEGGEGKWRKWREAGAFEGVNLRAKNLETFCVVPGTIFVLYGVYNQNTGTYSVVELRRPVDIHIQFACCIRCSGIS